MIEHLREVFDETDPMPAGLVEACSVRPGPTGWDLLPLVADPGGVRASRSPTLSFGETVTVEIGATLAGLVLPGMTVQTVEVRWVTGSVRVDVAPDGLFEAHGVPLGPVRLVLHGERMAVTEWFVR